MSNVRSLAVVIIVVTAWWLPVCGGADDSDATILKTAEEAVARVYEYTGFDEIRDVKGDKADEICRRMVVEDDNTPFLYDQIIGREVWEITLDDIYVDVPGWEPAWEAAYNPKNFRVLIDVETGVLYKVFTEWQDESVKIPNLPGGKSRTELMEQARIRYTGFVSKPAPATLEDALNAAAGAALPLMAGKIEAYAVRCTDPSIPEATMWVINTMGFPDDKEFFESDRWTAWVCAETGRLASVASIY